jgi:uncharacterized membrane protein
MTLTIITIIIISLAIIVFLAVKAAQIKAQEDEIMEQEAQATLREKKRLRNKYMTKKRYRKAPKIHKGTIKKQNDA